MESIHAPLRDAAFAARFLHVPESTLAYWRRHGRGPRFVRVGKHYRYLEADLDDFVQRNASTPQDAA